MKSPRIFAILAIGGAVAASQVSASTVSVDVFAKKDSVGYKTLLGADTGLSFKKGYSFEVKVDPTDTWKVGSTRADQEGNADGMTRQHLYTLFGQTFNHGTLVGQIGSGKFFEVGTYFRGMANATGLLKLFMWDKNYKDNSGFVTADVAPVPLPAGAPLLASGLFAAFALRRRKSA